MFKLTEDAKAAILDGTARGFIRDVRPSGIPEGTTAGTLHGGGLRVTVVPTADMMAVKVTLEIVETPPGAVVMAEAAIAQARGLAVLAETVIPLTGGEVTAVGFGLETTLPITLD